MAKGIILKSGFYQNPKVKRMEDALGFAGIRSLQIIWLWCAVHCPMDMFMGFPDDMESIADWHGEKNAFLEACIGEWIENTRTGYRLIGLGEIFDFCN